jgi:NAD(P)-dependent dehydrogenase (short-subunit alcohol dehydrogenase family)
MDLQLKNRVVLVVGGNGTIGSVIVERLAAEGATVISASRSGSGPQHHNGGESHNAAEPQNPAESDTVIARGTVTPLALDASDEASVAAGLRKLLETHGRLDAVVVSAAPSAQTLDPARKSDPDQVAEAMADKSLVFLRVANATIPVMREAGYGRVVAINGQNAYFTGNITNAVRNAALLVIAKNLADELAGTGVLVNTVNPGLVTETPKAEVALARGGESTPQQIADLVAFLASPLSAVSGESIAIGLRALGTTVL